MKLSKETCRKCKIVHKSEWSKADDLIWDELGAVVCGKSLSGVLQNNGGVSEACPFKVDHVVLSYAQ